PATITASTGSSASTITVTARDQYGNVIRGKTVVLAATGTGNALVQPSPDTTIASGVASGTLSSTVAQGKTVSATVAGTAITQQATVTVSPAAAASLDFIVQPSNVAAGVAIAPPVQVDVVDEFNNPVAGVPVTFAAGPGGSTVSPTTPVTTNASGIAAVTSWTLGHTAGTNTLTASATGLTGSPVTFSASGTAGPATQIALNAGNSQTAPAGTAVATPPSVLVRDQFNNPVAGVAVT